MQLFYKCLAVKLFKLSRLKTPLKLYDAHYIEANMAKC